MDISDLAARRKTRRERPSRKPGEKDPAGSQERKARPKTGKEGRGRGEEGRGRGEGEGGERGSAEQDVEHHHKGEAGGEPDGADVGVIAFGGFGHEFFDYHIEHCSGGE